MRAGAAARREGFDRARLGFGAAVAAPAAADARLRRLRGAFEREEVGAEERANAAGCFFARLPGSRFGVAAFFTRDVPRTHYDPARPIRRPGPQTR